MFETSIFVTILIGLFSLINPLGGLPVYISLTQDMSDEAKLKTLKKTCLYIILICIVSYFIGVYLLNFFGITIPALRVAGGLVIFRSGWQLLNVKHKKEISGKIPMLFVAKNFHGNRCDGSCFRSRAPGIMSLLELELGISK